MVSLTVFRFKQSMFREASSFKDKATGNEIQVAAGHIAEVEYADSQYSKIAKGKVKKLASREVNCEVEPPAPVGAILHVSTHPKAEI